MYRIARLQKATEKVEREREKARERERGREKERVWNFYNSDEKISP